MRSIIESTDQITALLGAGAVDEATWHDLRCFEAVALPIISQLWELEETQTTNYWQLINPYQDADRQHMAERCAEVASRVATELGEEAAACGAAALWLHPQLWQPAYNRAGQYYNLDRIQQVLLVRVAETYLRKRRPADWTQRLCRRILTICAADNPGGSPDVADCIAALLSEDNPLAGTLLNALTFGDWPAAWARLVKLADISDPAPAIYHALILNSWSSLTMPERMCTAWQSNGAQHVISLLWRLYRLGRLDSVAFRQVLEVLPHSLPLIARAVAWPDPQAMHNQDYSLFIQALHSLNDAVLWELLCDFRPEVWPTLQQISALSGGRFLLRIAEEVEQRGLTTLEDRYPGRTSAAPLLARLASVLRRRPDDDSTALIALLRQLSQQTLLALLPHATTYEAEICAALDWPQALELLALLRRLEQQSPARSADPSAGVVYRREVLAQVEPMAEEHLRMLLDAFKRQCPAATVLVQAVLGWNRAELRRLLGRRNQLAARALPLLPLQKPEEVLQRYLLLARFAREANTSSAGRKAYERAAARAGLTNLALHAGYSDATRMEWALEDQIGAQRVNPGRTWSIEGYTLRLVLHDNGPAIEVGNGKRILKRTPSAVTRDYAYRDVRETLEQAQDQQRRYGHAFLEAMRRGEPLSAEELALLRRNPLAVHLLERLVLVDATGAVGLFRAEDSSLEGLYGERVPISGSITIAHPYTLARIGVLANWQTEIVRRQIVQPFKQVFRELYVLTPAELEAGYTSGRLAGRRLKGRQAMAVLANLGWMVDGSGTVRCPFYDRGYTAYFETGAFIYGYDEDDSIGVTGGLSFWPLEREYAPSREQRLHLAAIEPLVLSEVLRDLDLVTVVAHQGEEQGTSREVLRQRGDLVRATVAALGLRGVRVEEPLVFVEGSLASYRIHLATAAVYLQSGQYLCIVPKRIEQQAIYLPFADGGEPVSSEVMSKLLLLLNDTQINDGTILAQIGAMQRAA